MAEILAVQVRSAVLLQSFPNDALQVPFGLGNVRFPRLIPIGSDVHSRGKEAHARGGLPCIKLLSTLTRLFPDVEHPFAPGRSSRFSYVFCSSPPATLKSLIEREPSD